MKTMKKTNIASTLLTALCSVFTVFAEPGSASVTVHTAPLDVLKDTDTVVTNVDVSLDLTPYATKTDVDSKVSLSRDKGDLNVYRPSAYGDWEWIQAPSEEVRSALSSVKPECTYSYSDGSEWSINTSVSLGHVNGWTSAVTPEPLELTFYIDVYDDNWNYLYEHSGSAVCRRKATAYIDTGDKLATRSDIRGMEVTVDKVYATLAGERLVSRTGLRGAARHRLGLYSGEARRRPQILET